MKYCKPQLVRIDVNMDAVMTGYGPCAPDRFDAPLGASTGNCYPLGIDAFWTHNGGTTQDCYTLDDAP